MDPQGWIALAERLPTEVDADPQGCVLVWHRLSGCLMAHIGRVHTNEFTTHWMALPGEPAGLPPLERTVIERPWSAFPTGEAKDGGTVPPLQTVTVRPERADAREQIPTQDGTIPEWVDAHEIARNAAEALRKKLRGQ